MRLFSALVALDVANHGTTLLLQSVGMTVTQTDKKTAWPQ